MKVSAVIIAILFFAVSHSVQVKAEPLTSEQGDAILKELKEINTLLQKMSQQNRANPARQLPTEARVKSAGDFSLGSQDAPVTMVEFTDFQCPFCKRFHDVVFPEIKKKYIDNGKLRYVSRDLPLSFHANALIAANAARCAGEQNSFWQFRDVLFAKAPNLKEDEILGYAKDLSLDMKQFQVCLASKKFNQDIAKDLNEANAAGLTGTPSFVLGKTGADGYVDGDAIIGAKPFPYIEVKIQEVLTRK